MSKSVVFCASLAFSVVPIAVDAKENDRLIFDLLVCGWSYASEEPQDKRFEDFIVKAGELAAIADRGKAWLDSAVRDAEGAAGDRDWKGRRGTVCAESLERARMMLKAE